MYGGCPVPSSRSGRLGSDVSRAWFPYDLRPSEAVCVGLIADDRKHRRQLFKFKSEATADKCTTNPLRSEE